MKRTIATGVLFFAITNAMAQTPDSLPPVNMNIDTMPVLDTTKKWNNNNNENSMQQPGMSDSTAKWKNDANTRWHVDSTKTPMNKDTTSSNTIQKNNTGVDTATKEKLSDRVIMKEGQMMVLKNGEETKMEKNVTLPSGTVITTDGTVKKKDGSMVKLKDGQFIALPSATEKKPGLKKMPEKKAPLKKSKQ